MQRTSSGPIEFHVSRRARDRYQFDESLFSFSGNAILADFYAARLFSQKMNETRDLIRFPEQAVKASDINAMGLIDEIAHLLLRMYREQVNPSLMSEALDWMNERIGPDAVSASMRQFGDEFPALPVYRREVSLDDYLDGETDGVPHRHLVLEEMVMLWLANLNPAFAPFRELFDDETLSRQSAYPQMMLRFREFFDSQPGFGPGGENLIDLLRAPALAHPHSLMAQLEFVRRRWGSVMGKQLYRLLRSLDLIQEEQRAVFGGPGPSRVYEYGQLEFEVERFSPDQHWMPRLVLLAKNAYVWLHQLSQKYERTIGHLGEIPDQELDLLADQGFSGLWLIGLWERSQASQRIKQLCGNPEAVASAYSLYDYQIATALGGEAAYQTLRDRAWQRGIRLASDMVPNHVGIDARWVVEHPDWFISLDRSPFPSYRFQGPDLSSDERVGIFVEDHYYDRSDAAVVFKRVDRWTGSEQYIYHGNDGTSMPWNDTAQLNYLNAEVREAVIQTILQVARRFPIIRFDAAMTLAKKHFQRLWFPEPGTGGDIPSRAEHGLSKAEFDAAMPKEFWREVVDRVAAEAPDTLLLAEAFWLLEGYFVRTLGMHRVYNSAFMHMLRDEDNGKYRSVIKNTLEFDREILKRFVNFMNNPDEDTAVAQFGKGDKYFGICTLLATLPGLPMFGHGQIEGLAEKYGMEYQRAYWDEHADEQLMERHEREIFPLLHQRHLFAEVESFLLFDFGTVDGHVDENVFAYANRSGQEHALVVYHNRYASTRGWIHNSVPYSVKAGGDGDRALVQKTLAEGLDLQVDAHNFCIFRDHITGREYIRNSQELAEKGLYVELEAYKCHVFLDWREVKDNEWGQYAHLAEYLDGRGVPSIEEALREVFLQTIHYPFKELVHAGHLRWLFDNRAKPVGAPDGKEQVPVPEAVLDDAEGRVRHLLYEIAGFVGDGDDPEMVARADAIAKELRHKLQACLSLPQRDTVGDGTRSPIVDAAVTTVTEHMGNGISAWGTLLGWLFTHALGKVVTTDDAVAQSRSWLDEWLLGKLLAASLQELGLDKAAAWWSVGTAKLLIAHQDWFGQQDKLTTLDDPERAYQVLTTWLKDGDVQEYLQVNRYGGVLWFNHESFEQWLAWMLTLAVVQIDADPEATPEQAATRIGDCYQLVHRIAQAEKESEFQIVKLLEAAATRESSVASWEGDPQS